MAVADIQQDGEHVCQGCGVCESQPTVDFSCALDELKKGTKMQRLGWNGKGLYVVARGGYPGGVTANDDTLQTLGLKSGDSVVVEPYLNIVNTNGDVPVLNTWIPSVSDLFATDWVEYTG